MKLEIRLEGCDDSTEILMEVNKEQYEFLAELAYLSKTISTCSCQPVIEFEIIIEDKADENQKVK